MRHIIGSRYYIIDSRYYISIHAAELIIISSTLAIIYQDPWTDRLY